MKHIFIFLLLSLIYSPLAVFSQTEARVDTFRLFYLGGQSNMDGYGFIEELPDSLNKTFQHTWIFHGNSLPDDQPGGGKGLWAPLKPGHGAGFTSDGKENSLSGRFGVELSLAGTLQRLYPDEQIALIKYSRGGTSIDSAAAGSAGCWEPDYRGHSGINQYDHFLATVRHAMADEDINDDGRKDCLIPQGIIWMQGESDAAFTQEIAGHYYAHLKRLMNLMRATFRQDDLPVAVGKISDSWNDKDGKVWDHGDLVQYAEEKFVRQDAFAAIVRTTRYYDYSDPWHYDSEGYIDLGGQFARAIYRLNGE
ncbi:MAG TPA: sialate O-acetylesterase [Bacteroidales bacterium]|nr:sialate O-acetylesterase [Bacteroidales bacterium]